MRFIRRIIVRGALTAGAAYAAYRLLLDDAARENVKLALGRVAEIASEAGERLSSIRGVEADGRAGADPAEAVRRQWESLGL